MLTFCKNCCRENFSSSSRDHYLEENFQDLNEIDINSDSFKNLPANIRHEILSELKDKRKRKWVAFQDMPNKDGQSFSNFQMLGLLKRSKLQRRLEEVEKEMLSEETNKLMIGLGASEKAETRKIASENVTHSILIKTVKPTDSKTVSLETTAIENPVLKCQPTSSRDVLIKSAISTDSKIVHLQETPVSKIKATSSKHAIVYSEEIYDDDEFIDPDSPTYKSQHFFEQLSILASFENDKINPEETDYNLKPVNFEIGKQSGNFMYCKNEQLDLITPIYNLDDVGFISDSSSDSSATESNKTDSILLSKGLLKNGEPELKTEMSTINLMNFKSGNASVQVNQSKDKPIHTNICILEKESEKSPLWNEEVNPIKDVADNRSSFTLVNPKNPFEKASTVKTKLVDLTSVSKSVNKDSLSKCTTTISESEVLSFSPITSTQKIILPSQSTSSMIQEFLPEEESQFFGTRTTSVLGNDLKSTIRDMSEEKLLDFEDKLDTETEFLRKEKGRQERMARSLSDQIFAESQDFLKLFGVPYVVSPMEAEAQCAQLELLGLTQGTITDDSDIWLFGGKKVYKNFFTQGKYLESFTSQVIKEEFGLDRTKMICFALLTGSDYTEGIDGVGYVTAMEIISEFKGEGFTILKEFKDWWKSIQDESIPPRTKVRAKLSKLALPESFPSHQVFEAYIQPTVDSSNEKFSWGTPDLCALREFARDKFGWNQSKVDEFILPVMKKVNERQSQMRLDSFFQVKLTKEKNLFPSKRLESALKKLHPGQEHKNNAQSRSSKVLSRVAKLSKKKVIGKGQTKQKRTPVLELSESSSSE